MKKFVRLIGLLLDLCDAANFGCCGIHEEVCIKCCQNYHMDNGKCQECPPGYSGDKCNKKCVYPWYGSLCGSSCSNDPNNCSRDDCHPALGCQSPGSRLFTNMLTGSSRKHTNHVVTRPMTTIHINTPAREDLGTRCNTKDSLLSASIVKSLGYTLAMSLLVILGLICLLILRKRRGSLSGKSVTVSQPSEYEFRLLSARSHQNVDRCLVASSNSINNPPVYQDHSKIVRLSEADSMGETESVSESRNTIVYMHMTKNSAL